MVQPQNNVIFNATSGGLTPGTPSNNQSFTTGLLKGVQNYINRKCISIFWVDLLTRTAFVCVFNDFPDSRAWIAAKWFWCRQKFTVRLLLAGFNSRLQQWILRMNKKKSWEKTNESKEIQRNNRKTPFKTNFLYFPSSSKKKKKNGTLLQIDLRCTEQKLCD